MIPITHPFGFAEGRLFSQSARKGLGNWLSQLRSSPFLRNTALSPATLKATLFLSRSLCSWRADWRPAMMVSNSSALWSARAWLQSSRILSSSRRFGTLTAEPFYPQIGAVCDTAHTVFLGGDGCRLSFFKGGIPRLSPAFLVIRAAPRSSSAAMIPITQPLGFAEGRLFSQSAKGWGGRRNLVHEENSLTHSCHGEGRWVLRL